MTTTDLDVLVIGAGPTGLATAALLAREGVRVAAITRYPGLANSPRAHIINQRTMEVFRDLGIADRIAAHAMPADLMGSVVWAESFTGREIARRRGWGAGADRRGDYAAASPCVPTNIPQHVLEPLLAEAVVSLGGEVRYSLELVTMTQDADGVRSVCRDRVTGEEVVLNSRYAVGADGDNSTVCRELGFEVEGMSGLGHMLNFWVRADLGRYVAHRPGALYQVFRPGGGAFVDNAMFVNVAPWDEWVLSLPYDPEHEPDRSEAAAIELVRAYVGDADLAVELIGTSTWTINQVHAEVLHRDRVLIAGNAAHRHPPAGGLGANTCVQDAFNLAWKIAALLNGTGGPGLLASYTAERAPVARQIVERANVSLAALLAIPAAIGLAPGQTEAEGVAALDSRFEDSALGRERRTALAEALTLQDYNFNALGVELGQRYDSAIITGNGSVFVPTRDEALYYEATTIPGASLPHAWLGDGRSTLDITGRGRFTLLTGIGGAAWRDEVARLGADVDVVVIGPGGDREDPFGEWAALRGTAEDGAVLVRPDHHVAFRAETVAGVPQLAAAIAAAKGF